MNFLRKITLLLSLLGGICGSIQPQDAKEYFLQMPDSVLPYLSAVNKADMPDFISSKMAAKVKNRLHATTEMKQLTADYLEIETSIASSFQLKILPLSDSTRIIALINTAKGPVADSQIRFYTPEWKELTTEDFFTPPTVEDFMLPVGTLIEVEKAMGEENEATDSTQQETELFTEEQYQIARSTLNQTRLFYYYFTPEDDTSIRIVFTTPEYLEDQSKRYIRKEPLLFEWNNGRFVRLEN